MRGGFLRQARCREAALEIKRMDWKPGPEGPFFPGGDFGGLKPAAFSVVPLRGT